MTDKDRTSRIEHWRRCHALAMQRARMARRQGRNRLVALLVFLWALLSAVARSRVDAGYPQTAPSPRPRTSGTPETEDWPMTDYERGLGGDVILRPRPPVSQTGRYRSRPSLARLMADLRRPAAREDAALALLARIPDPVTRTWAVARIAGDQVNRLSIWVRPGRSEADTLAVWRDEADAALADEQAAVASPSPDRGSLLDVAKLLEAIAGTETVTASGPKRPGGA